jgi:hypothetical protein
LGYFGLHGSQGGSQGFRGRSRAFAGFRGGGLHEAGIDLFDKNALLWHFSRGFRGPSRAFAGACFSPNLDGFGVSVTIRFDLALVWPLFDLPAYTLCVFVMAVSLCATFAGSSAYCLHFCMTLCHFDLLAHSFVTFGLHWMHFVPVWWHVGAWGYTPSLFQMFWAHMGILGLWGCNFICFEDVSDTLALFLCRYWQPSALWWAFGAFGFTGLPYGHIWMWLQALWAPFSFLGPHLGNFALKCCLVICLLHYALIS